ncbi:Peptidyl-prolyl cis-trans isomerase FKBP62 [Camellia lanceoleosa]|uniref:Peptidyl-prolyl cis-trans isomerase FKBP62 n=1 Tax=Camellia lanceoleosa TaxID=1840588 RepID=A0ACC0HZ84_9ERIC|nr:Peptidyl-prolyl cis-trans isomerase FKBP62 [Camellia lanceoleosa]
MSDHTSTHHGHILDPSWSPPPYRTAVGTPVTPLAPLSTTCLSTIIPSVSTLTAPDPLTVPSSPTPPSSLTPHIPFTYHVDLLITHDFHIDGEGEGQVHAPTRGTGRGRGCGGRRGVSRGRGQGRGRGRRHAIDHDNNAADDGISRLSLMGLGRRASRIGDEVKLIGKLEDGTIFLKKGHDNDEKQVIEGLDIAVMTMKKGEIALLTVAPEYAFGSSESHQELAVVPPNSYVMYSAGSTYYHNDSALPTTTLALTDNCLKGTCGRLVFSPSQCLIFPAPKPFFCCVVPAFYPIFVPEDVDTFDVEAPNIAMPSLSPPPKILQGNTMTNSIVEVFKQVAVRLQDDLLNVLKSKDFHDHQSMIIEACFIFCALVVLFVDSQPFKEQAEEFISCAA